MKPPEAAHRIAVNPFPQNTGFAIGKITFSLHGHLEFPIDYAEESLGILKKKVGKEPTCDALSTLNRPPDYALVANWIRHFFLQHAVS